VYQLDYAKMGKKIREERIRLNLTMQKFAEKADINDNFLGKIERGEGNPSLETTVKIANALGVGVDLLLGNELKVSNEHLIQEIVRYTEKLSPEQKRFLLEFVKHNSELIRDFDFNRLYGK